MSAVKFGIRRREVCNPQVRGGGGGDSRLRSTRLRHPRSTARGLKLELHGGEGQVATTKRGHGFQLLMSYKSSAQSTSTLAGDTLGINIISYYCHKLITTVKRI